MNAFTIWTVPALENVELATTNHGGYGVAYMGEVWFRFCDGRLHCHCMASGSQRDAFAQMERRKS